jgi:hypothetical protein
MINSARSDTSVVGMRKKKTELGIQEGTTCADILNILLSDLESMTGKCKLKYPQFTDLSLANL